MLAVTIKRFSFVGYFKIVIFVLSDDAVFDSVMFQKLSPYYRPFWT